MLVIARYEKPAQNGAAGVLTRCFGSRRCPHLRRPGGACPFHFCKARTKRSRRCPHLRRPEGACSFHFRKVLRKTEPQVSPPAKTQRGLPFHDRKARAKTEPQVSSPDVLGAAGVLTRCFGSRRCPHLRRPEGACPLHFCKALRKTEPQVSPPAKTQRGLPFHFCKALRALADGDVCHSNILGAAGVPTCEDPEGLVLFISVKHCGLWQTGTSATPIFWEQQVSPPAKTRRGLPFHSCKALRALADGDVCHSNILFFTPREQMERSGKKSMLREMIPPPRKKSP